VNERPITVILLLNLSLLFILLSSFVVLGKETKKLEELDGGRDVHDEVKETTNTRIKKKFVLEEFSAKHPLVREELLKRGWEELTNRREGDEGGRQARHRFFDLKWTWRWVPVSRSQWLNHFSTYPEIGYKVHLAKNLRRLSSNGEDDAKSLKSWWPRAYILFSGGFNYHMTSEDTKSDEYLLRGLTDERNSFLQDFNRLRKLEETTIKCEGEECVIESSSSPPDSSSSSSSSSSSPFELQPSIDGEEDIWIVKPGVLARGLGIKIFNDSQKVLSYIDSYQHVLGDSFVVQKYIETPFLAQARKFDIRQFVLVTSLNPLTIFMFHKCYLRFCHVEYSHSDLENKSVCTFLPPFQFYILVTKCTPLSSCSSCSSSVLLLVLPPFPSSFSFSLSSPSLLLLVLPFLLLPLELLL
jgi:hypothetical protein